MNLVCHQYMSVGRSQDLLVYVLQAASTWDKEHACLRKIRLFALFGGTKLARKKSHS